MDPSVWITQGGFAVALAITVWMLKEERADNRELHKQRREDQARMGDALAAAQEQLRAARDELVRSRALAERERQ